MLNGYYSYASPLGPFSVFLLQIQLGNLGSTDCQMVSDAFFAENHAW